MSDTVKKKQRQFRIGYNSALLMNTVIQCTMSCPQKYRPNYVHYMQQAAMDIYQLIFEANQLQKLDSSIKMRNGAQALAKLKYLGSLADEAQKYGCLSFTKEAMIHERITEIQPALEGWIHVKPSGNIIEAVKPQTASLFESANI